MIRSKIGRKFTSFHIDSLTHSEYINNPKQPTVVSLLWMWMQHSCTVCPKDVVPVGEVGGVVATVLSMVGLVMGSSSQTGQESVQSPGQVVAAVVFHRQPAVEDVEDDFAQRVTTHHPGAAQGQQQQRQQLGRAGVLGCQSEGHVVLVVQLVDAAVEPGNPEEEKTAVFVYTVTVMGNHKNIPKMMT